MPRHSHCRATAGKSRQKDIFLMSVFLPSEKLPAKVATHFNAAGQADGWMTKNGHVLVILLIGFLISDFLIAVS